MVLLLVFVKLVQSNAKVAHSLYHNVQSVQVIDKLLLNVQLVHMDILIVVY